MNNNKSYFEQITRKIFLLEVEGKILFVYNYNVNL